MKRTALVLSLILIISALFVPAVYADGTLIAANGLQIVSTTPRDGETGKQPQNMAVKFEFSENMIDEAKIAANTPLFSVKNASGTAIKFDVVYNASKYPNELWLILDETLESNSEYTCTAKAGIASASGNTLASDYTFTFKTRNTKTDATLSTVLMFVMMGFMLFTTVRSAKKMAEEQMNKGKGPQDDDKNMNPYKLAKAKNISVEKATAIIEKDKAKQAKKQEKYEEEKAKYAADYDEQVKKFEAEIRAEMEAERRANNYHVKRPASVKAAGGTIPRSVIKANRKKREAREKEAARANAKKMNKKK
jgi:hypothetical protein